MVQALRRGLAAEWSPPGWTSPLRLSGLPVISVNLVEHVTADLKTFGAASFAFFVLAFWAGLPPGALEPSSRSSPASSRWPSVVGGAAAAGQKITVITSNAPVLLFVLMLPYTVYFVESGTGSAGRNTPESRTSTPARTRARIWAPCLYSCSDHDGRVRLAS